ncbi:hypothetical protein [Microbacterium sp. TWP3-1-2b2]|uniref:hypothetical protein n=1 Tax=Microbacterium sp. TWP3-1-2b2 TaxID=2804651 RepID=UPI003CEE8D96
MLRVLKVVRLQLVNKQTYLWVPLIVLGGSLLVSILIYAMIPIDQPKYGGGSQAPLWAFLFVGIQALTMVFPFSQAMSVTRRDFYLGTLITAMMTSVILGVVFILGGLFELWTNGWGINGYFFHLPWVWESGPIGAGFIYAVLTLLIFIIGFTSATIYKSWGPLVLLIASFALVLILLGLVFLVTRLELWGQVWMGILDLGALGLALWGLVAIVVMAGISFLAFRRTIP